MTSAVLPTDPTERRVLLVLILMFVAGVSLGCSEVLRWWKARLAQYRPPPLAPLITYVRDRDGSWRPTKVLWFPLKHLPATPEALPTSDDRLQEDRPNKAA